MSVKLLAVVLALALGGALYGAVRWMTVMPGAAATPAASGAPVDPAELARRLRAHVDALAGDIGVRHRDRGDTLARAADYVADAFESLGYMVRLERFDAGGHAFRNVEVERTGTARPGEIVLVGAHYDTVAHSPGADDNASGVAALIELARLLEGVEAARTIRLVAFANEEAPFFMTGQMGALVHARRARARGERVSAMFSLEMLGYYDARPGTQDYPRALAWLYPDTGDFLAFVGNLRSRALLRRAVATFRGASRLPAEGLAAPGSLLPDIRRSDHAAFWAHGYPAIMVTDTAGFRYDFYHSPLDTPDGLDYGRMAQGVAGLRAVVIAEALRR